MSEAVFGRYLVSVEERDVDLLLMEEFHVTEEFTAWFCAQLGLRNATPIAAWHSVSDAEGETDLLLQVIVDGRKIGVMIENKIGAPEQDRQADRYHLRGRRYCEEGKFHNYVTVICAPERYLTGLPDKSPYHHRVSYESIIEWFASCEGPRAAWRCKVMQEAVGTGATRLYDGGFRNRDRFSPGLLEIPPDQTPTHLHAASEKQGTQLQLDHPEGPRLPQRRHASSQDRAANDGARFRPTRHRRITGKKSRLAGRYISRPEGKNGISRDRRPGH